jgi:hypothetical protein
LVAHLSSARFNESSRVSVLVDKRCRPLRALANAPRKNLADLIPRSQGRKGLRMLSAVVTPIRRALIALVGAPSTNRLSAGFALGLVIHLAPQGNLVALSLFVLLFSLRCDGEWRREAAP